MARKLSGSEIHFSSFTEKIKIPGIQTRNFHGRERAHCFQVGGKPEDSGRNYFLALPTTRL